MARTRTRSNRDSKRGKGKGKGPSVAFVKSPDERQSGSRYLSLRDDEKFEGYALFDPDVEAEKNPGYVEFKQHWDNQRSTSVPCWDKKNGCIYCKAGMNPSQRAYAGFLVTSFNGEEQDPEVRIFRMNWSMIEEWSDTLEEDGSTLGQLVRIKCLDHQGGEYTTKFFDKKRLSKKQLAESLEELPDLHMEVQRQLDRALENLRVQDVLEDDDDDDDDDEDEEETPKRKSSSRKTKKEEVEDEDDDEGDEEDEDEDEDEDDDENEDEDDEDDDEDDDEEDEKKPSRRKRRKVKKDEDEDDDEDEESDDEDEDEEEDDEDEKDEEDEEEESDEEESSIEGTYTIVSANDAEMTFTLKELDSDLYLEQDLSEEVDFDDFKKNDKVTIAAEKDSDGDWVATKLEKEKGKGKDKGSSKGKGKDKKSSGKGRGRGRKRT